MINTMTKTLEQIQEENRKFIIMANNPHAKSYEEALEMELENQIPCAVRMKYNGIGMTFVKFIFYSLGDELIELGGKRHSIKRMANIIGGQLTLSRIFVFLKNNHFSNIWYFCFDTKNSNIYGFNDEEEILFSSYWDLMKETLEEQTEETQREINKLLEGK